METDPKHYGRLNKLFGFKQSGRITKKDILDVLNIGEQEGLVSPKQHNMILNVLEFKNTVAEDIMTHRVDIEAIEENSSILELLDTAIKNGFSRIPVYKESIDNIIGIVYVKDLLNLVSDKDVDSLKINKFVREALYVPETINCWDLFSQFTEKHQHIAVVVDEYGGTSGIVTLEDVLETIVGEIQDEYDNEQALITKVNETTFTMDGSADLETVCEILGIEIEKSSDFDTIGGFLIDRLGRIPDESEHPVIKYMGIEFTILVIEERHIEKIRAVKIIKNSQPT